jgi:hypothetical protein
MMHPCDNCGDWTDDTELQVPPHLRPEGDELWCAECIHAHDAESWKPEQDDTEEDA